MKGINLLKYILMFWLSSQCSLTVAQNPFELQHRLEEGNVEVNATLNPGNPFDKELTNKVINPLEKTTPNKIRKPVKKQVSSPAGQLRFWIMTVSLILLTLLITLYKSLIGKAYRAFINENFLKLIHRNEGRIVSIPFLLLYGLYLLNMGTFIYLISVHFGWLFAETQTRQFYICLLGITLVFLFKHILLMVIGGIFPISKSLRRYSFTIVIFNIILGLVLVPFNLFIAFAAIDLARVLIYVLLALIAAFYLYRTFRGLLIAGNSLSLHKFHFFMYLCTVEIAPVFLLVSLVSWMR